MKAQSKRDHKAELINKRNIRENKCHWMMVHCQTLAYLKINMVYLLLEIGWVCKMFYMSITDAISI